MAIGLTPNQEIIEVKMRSIVGPSFKEAIDRVLATKPLHRIVSMTVTSSEEFNTAGIALLVIEYIDETAGNTN